MKKLLLLAFLLAAQGLCLAQAELVTQTYLQSLNYLSASSPTNHGVLLGAGSQTAGVTGAGTSGQVLTSNGASADPTFQAAGGGALTKICSLSASASASLDFTSGNCGGSNVFTSTYNEYEIKITSLVLNTNTADLAMLVSTNGSTFVSSGYIATVTFFQLNNGSNSGFLNSTTEIQLDNSYGTGATRGNASGTIYAHNPLDATNDKTFDWQIIVPNVTSWFRFNGGAVYDSASAILAFQIKPSSGTITSGTVTIYGYQK